MNLFKIIFAFFSLLMICPLSTYCQPQEDKIHLMARPYANSVLLRWAPADYNNWMLMNRSGVRVQRRTIGRGEFINISPVLRPLTLEEFKTRTNTDDPHIVATAEAIYGGTEIVSSAKGPMEAALNSLNEQSERFMMAAVNADLSAAAAAALGWRFIDKDLDPGIPYEYRIVCGDVNGASSFISQPLRAKTDSYYDIPIIEKVKTRSLEKAIEISWPKSFYTQFFIGYYLEKSTDDGASYKRINQIPLIKDPEAEEEDWFHYVDKVSANYKTFNYRVVGITSFAELSRASEAVEGQGIDLSAPLPPSEVQVKDLRNGEMRVSWKNTSKAQDHRGFIVARSGQLQGPYKPIHEGTVPLYTLEFIDKSPIPFQTNYYAVYSIDEHDNTLRSPVAMGIWRDNTPPGLPKNLTGKVDSSGHVFLMWEPGKDRDLHGYRVYYSHAKDREFLQITTEILKQNYFFDTITTKTLTEHIHYRIVAVDHNFNPSEYSEILTLQRPDNIAPNAPVIHKYSAAGERISLEWKSSSSPDVLIQEVWRKSESEDWKKVGEVSITENRFTDQRIRKNTKYSYRLQVIDDAGLSTLSKELIVDSGNFAERIGAGQLVINYDAAEQRAELNWEHASTAEAEILIYRSFDNSPIRLYKKIQTSAKVWQEKVEAINLESLNYALQISYPDGTQSPISNIAKTKIQ